MELIQKIYYATAIGTLGIIGSAVLAFTINIFIMQSNSGID